MKSSFYRLSSLLALAAVLFAGQVAAQDGASLLRRLQNTYTTSTSLRAEFTQTMTSAYGDEQFSGTLLVHGNRYRVEAGPQQFVTDGQTTWLYNRTQNQVIINDFVEDESTFSPTGFITRYGNRYRVTNVAPSTVQGQRHYTLTLAPRSDDEFFEEVKVTMRDRDNVVTRLDLRDVNGTRMRYELRNVQFNPTLAATAFRFATPNGAEVVDLRN